MKNTNKELTQEEKEKLLIERIIDELESLPIDDFCWKIKYCIGLLEGFKAIKYNNK